MAENEMFGLYPVRDFRANQDLIESLIEYTEPPHEPVPELEGLNERTRSYLASEAGIVAVQRWTRVYEASLQRLSDYAANQEPDTMDKVVDIQRILLGGLVRKLEGRIG